jgi:hypothetical protein
VGWTQNTVNNSSVRIVSSVGGGSGGTIGFSTLFSATSSYTGGITITSGQVGDTVINESQLASHSHGCSNDSVICRTTQGGGVRPVGADFTYKTSVVGNNEAHTHSLVGAAANGTFTSNFDLEYVNMILATKS